MSSSLTVTTPVHIDCTPQFVDTTNATNHKRYVFQEVTARLTKQLAVNGRLAKELALIVLQYYDFPKITFNISTAKVISGSSPTVSFESGDSLYPTQFLIVVGHTRRMGFVDFNTGQEVRFPIMDKDFHESYCAIHKGKCYTLPPKKHENHLIIASMIEGRYITHSSTPLSLTGWTSWFRFGTVACAKFDNLRQEWIAASMDGHLIIFSSLLPNGTSFQQVTRIKTGHHSPSIHFAKCLKNEKIVIVTENTCEVWDLKTKEKVKGCEFLELKQKRRLDRFADAFVMDDDETIVLTVRPISLVFLKLPSCTLLNEIHGVSSYNFPFASNHPDHIWVAGDRGLTGYGHHSHVTETIHFGDRLFRVYTNGTQLIAHLDHCLVELQTKSIIYPLCFKNRFLTASAFP